jgi:hypothetical protein|uniref:Uncharacterized protein n=1 Tax=Fagus sylvatica TaxID=28930 RepID=A0A2N9GKN1_FAGSY
MATTVNAQFATRKLNEGKNFVEVLDNLGGGAVVVMTDEDDYSLSLRKPDLLVLPWKIEY